LHNINDASHQIKYRQAGGNRTIWRDSNFAKQGNIAKLVNIK